MTCFSSSPVERVVRPSAIARRRFSLYLSRRKRAPFGQRQLYRTAPLGHDIGRQRLQHVEHAVQPMDFDAGLAHCPSFTPAVH